MNGDSRDAISLTASETDAVQALLEPMDITGPWTARPLSGGANNRVFRICPDASQTSVILKIYFHHDSDLRPRLDTEYAFVTFSHAHGITCVPAPLGSNPEQHLALYAESNGRPAVESDMPEAVRQSVTFIE